MAMLVLCVLCNVVTCTCVIVKVGVCEMSVEFREPSVWSPSQDADDTRRRWRVS